MSIRMFLCDPIMRLAGRIKGNDAAENDDLGIGAAHRGET